MGLEVAASSFVTPREKNFLIPAFFSASAKRIEEEYKVFISQ